MNDLKFFDNIEKLSKFYIKQCFNSGTYKIRTPYYFIQKEEKKRKAEIVKKGESTMFIMEHPVIKRSPSKHEDDKINPLGDFNISRPLRAISEEEYYRSTSFLDHNKITLHQVNQREVSEEIEAEKSDSES